MIANWSPACELAVSFVSPFAELIVVPLTEVITLARPADRAGESGESHERLGQRHWPSSSAGRSGAGAGLGGARRLDGDEARRGPTEDVPDPIAHAT